MSPQQLNDIHDNIVTALSLSLSLSASCLAGVWELACPALSMLARRQSAREMFIEMGGVGHVAGVLTRLGMSPSLSVCVCCLIFVSGTALHTVQLTADSCQH